jgi:flagellar motor switch protein FliN/FliY
MTPPRVAPTSVPLELGEIPAARGAQATPLDALIDVSLPVVIEFGRASMTVQQVLGLGPGSVIQLDRMVGEPVDIYVSDRRLAQGDVVVMGEYFGIRITRVLTSRSPGSPT